MIINRIYEHQNLLSLQLVSFLGGLRTYQYPVLVFIRSNVGIESWGMNEFSFVFCLCRRLWELRCSDPLSKELCRKSGNKIHKRGSRVVLSYSAIDTCRWIWDRTRTGGIICHTLWSFLTWRVFTVRF